MVGESASVFRSARNSSAMNAVVMASSAETSLSRSAPFWKPAWKIGISSLSVGSYNLLGERRKGWKEHEEFLLLRRRFASCKLKITLSS